MHAAVGGITESDINLALASKAVVDRLQRARRRAGAQARREQRRADPLLRHHLRRGRRREGGAVRHADAGAEGERSSVWSRCARSTGSRRSARSPGCYVLEGLVKRGAQDPRAARQRRHPRRRARFAEALQGRRARGEGGIRVRPVDQELQRRRRRATSSRSTRSSKSRGRCKRGERLTPLSRCGRGAMHAAPGHSGRPLAHAEMHAASVSAANRASHGHRQRAQRVGDEIQRDLADLLRTEVKDPRVGR